MEEKKRSSMVLFRFVYGLFYIESEFNEFEPRLKSAKTRFQLLKH